MACLSTSHIYSTTITTTTIAVTWEPVVTAIEYQVEYQVKPTYPAPLGTWILLATQTTVGANIGNLISGTTYLIRVNCICETGECYSVTIEVSTN
jgi:hypothetical protein